jgi:hypothetical protein
MSILLHISTRHRGEPNIRQLTLASRGFRWQPRAGLWRRGRLVLSDGAIDAMTEGTLTALLRHCDRHRDAYCFEQGGPGWS